MEEFGKCFETLSNKKRLKILSALEEGSLTVSELAKKIGEERSSVSHNLQMLRACRHVIAEKRGRKNYYFLNPKSVFVSLNGKAQNISEAMKLHVGTNCSLGCRKTR